MGAPSGLYGCTQWVIWVHPMGYMGAPNGLYGCTQWVIWVHPMGYMGAPNGLCGCTQWIFQFQTIADECNTLKSTHLTPFPLNNVEKMFLYVVCTHGT